MKLLYITSVTGASGFLQTAIDEATRNLNQFRRDNPFTQIQGLSAQTIHTGGENGWFYHIITVTYLSDERNT